MKVRRGQDQTIPSRMTKIKHQKLSASVISGGRDQAVIYSHVVDECSKYYSFCVFQFQHLMPKIHIDQFVVVFVYYRLVFCIPGIVAIQVSE